MASSSSNNVLQFKITLKYLKPPIWRRIQVPADYTFKLLHFAIQDSMGWRSNIDDYHLHAFRKPENRQRNERDYFIEPNTKALCEYDFSDPQLSDRTNLRDYFIEPNTKALYEYDLGSTWFHDIVLEKILPAVEGTAYPKCIGGRRVTPPEDICESDEEYEDDDPEPEKFDRNSVIFHEGDPTKEIK